MSHWNDWGNEIACLGPPEFRILLVNMKQFVPFIFLCLLFPTALLAQNNMLGSQNVPTASDFDWKNLSTDNFDIHYHGGDPVLAAQAGKMAEEALWDICKTLDYKNRSRYALYIFLSPSDYARSNMSTIDRRFKEGGVTPLRNNTIPIIFPGTIHQFQREIKREVARLAIEDYYYGGSVQLSIQNTLLLYLPDWYIDGLTGFLGEGWTLEDELWLGSLDHSELLDLALEGHSPLHVRARKSIFYFIVSQYGEDKLSEIFYMTRLTRSAEDGVIHVLGITLKTLTERWREFVVQRLTELKTFRTETTEIGKEIEIDPKDRILGYAQNPVDKQVALLLEQEGQQRLVIRDLDTGLDTPTPITGGFPTRQFDQFYLRLPVEWSPNGNQIAAVVYQDGAEVLAFYNVESEEAVYTSFENRLDRIIEMNWSHDGRQLVASALKSGNVDLYRFSPGAAGFKPLTQDGFENLSPVWSQDDQRVYFASNRLNDTIANKDIRFDVYQKHFDVWELNLEDQSLRRVTELPLSDQFPVAAVSSFELLVRTSENGIYNLETFNVFIGERGDHSNVSYGFQSVDFTERNLLYAVPFEGKLKLYQSDLPTVMTEDARVRTSYQALVQRIEDRKIRAEQRKQRLDSLNRVRQDSIDNLPPIMQDTTTAKEDKPSGPPQVKYYVFDEEEEKPRATRRSYLRSRQLLKKKEPTKPDFNEIKYQSASKSKTTWTSDQVKVRFGYDPVFRLSLGLEARLKDQTGDRTIVAGWRPYLLARSSDTYFYFQNNKHKIDYQIGADRISRYLFRDGFSSRFNTSMVTGNAVLPLSRYLSVGAGVHAAYVNRQNVNIIIPKEIDGDDVYAGARLNVTYDKTRQVENFIQEGFFANFQAYNAFSARSTQNDFVTARMDLRKYIPVKKAVFATRLSAAWSSGPNPQQFFLGGTDEWLFSSFNNMNDFPLEQRSLSSFRYMEYVTPVHGFRFNSRNGSKYVVANAELRLPLARMFRSSLNTNPLYNVQLIPFFDFGTAWDTGNPLSQKNPIDTEVYNVYPLNITVQTLKSPFIMGFGAGLRMMLLGYQIRADLAWGVEDYTVLRPRPHLSLGKNF